MSIHKKQIVDNGQSNVDAAIQIANIISEATERLFKLQTEGASAALAENSKALRALLNVTDSGALLAEWPSLYQAKVQRALEVTRSWLEIVQQTQAEITQLMGKRYSMETQPNLEQFTKAISEGSNAVVTGMQDFFAKAGGHVSGRPAARK
jgi:phasin family protein